MQFFYEGKNQQGKPISGTIEANSSQDALHKLIGAGVGEPRVITSDINAVLRDDLAGMTPQEAQENLRKEMVFQKAKTGRSTFALALWESSKTNATVLALAAAYFTWGVFSHSPRRMIIGAAIFLYPYAALAWNWRRVNYYNELQKAMVFGEWQQARKYIAALRAKPVNEQLTMDLEVREGRLDIYEGKPLQPILERLEQRWRASVDKIPGTFAGRMLGMYEAAKDYAGYVAKAHEYLDAQPDSHERRLECAMAEARFGDVETARRLLNGVDAAQLNPIALRYQDWVAGQIALREGDFDKAIPALRKTVSAYEEFSLKLPMVLSIVALSSAGLALALARSGKKTEGQALLPPVEKILRVCADAGLQQQLCKELDWPTTLPA